METLTPMATTAPVAVVGADIDPALARSLDTGDKVLVEINGARFYSNNPCPLVAEHPWVVASNDPPEIGQKPQPQHRIVLHHKDVSHPIVLYYSNLLKLPSRQPAVFKELDPNLSCGDDGQARPTFVILQLISHWMPEGEVENEFEAHDEYGMKLVLRDEDMREGVLTKWAAMFKGFKKPGWGQKTVFRMAQRAAVRPQVIEAFQMDNWDAIHKLDMRTLYQIHEAVHWLQYFIRQAPVAVVRETLPETA